MKDNYSKLITFKFGKHTYDVLKEYDKVLYFEVQDDNYIMPIESFNLYDNQGKSLTSVNQHFFMNQLVNRINLACKKGIFVSDEEIVDYLSKLKNKVESDSELSGLFKGSLMTEINEDNFEKNKKSLLDYLDKNRFDTFVSYNNVSIFTGSLEKEPEVSNDLKSDVQETNIIEDQPVEEVVSNEPAEEIVVTPIEENSEEAVQFDNLDSVNVDDEPAVRVSDFFGNTQATNNGYESDFDMQDSNNSNNMFFDASVENSFDSSVDVETQPESVLNTEKTDVGNNVSDVFYGGFSDSTVSNDVPSNVSYIDEVKNRIGDNSSVVSDLNSMNTPAFEYQGAPVAPLVNSVSEEPVAPVNTVEPVTPNVNVVEPVTSNNEVSNNPLEEASVNTFSTEVQSDVQENTSNSNGEQNELSMDFMENTITQADFKKEGKKSSAGVIILIIILVLLLIGFSYYLYNYVF